MISLDCSAMSGVQLREVLPSDLPIFFEQEREPEARRMAAFVSKDPDRLAFDAHWKKILGMPSVTVRTIVQDGAVAGHVASFLRGSDREVTYWIARERWGQGVATQALKAFLEVDRTRPMHARVVKDNGASLRVLAKCGFRISAEDKGFAEGRGVEVEEYVLKLATGGSRSKTAVLVAGYRARNPELCKDPWAAKIAGAEGVELTTRYDRVNPHAGLYIAVRTAFIDSEVKRALASGVKQVVLLGAGLDVRAARLARPGVRFFEVDRAESQADKLARLRALDGYPLGAATHVPCELGREDFVAALVAAGFSTNEPAFVIWEGVTLYLSEEAVRGTLRTVSSRLHPRTTIVFDYIEKRLAEGRSSRQTDKEMLDLLADLGEPITFGMNDATPLLYEEGFRHIRTVNFDEACLTYTGTYDRDRVFRFQHLALASKTPPEEA